MEALPEYPEEGDLVVGTVKNVRNFGAFIELEEYPGKEGFIHVAEIATGWVKRMSDYVREGQRVVCKVLNVDRGKGHVDLSLKKVNAHQKREKIQEWKNEQKAQKLVEILAERCNLSPEEFMKKHGGKIIEEYGSLYIAFEEAARPDVGLDEKFAGAWVDKFCKVAEENVAAPSASIDGYLEIHCPDPAGVDKIRDALLAAENIGNGNVEVQYLGAPRYRIIATEEEYKAAEELIRKAAQAAIDNIEASGGTGRFDREGAK
jgi:translation initiation factor 2 subunit 1